MLNKNAIIKRFAKISRRMQYIVEKAELDEMKINAIHIAKLIKVDAGLGYTSGLKVRNIESEKIKEMCDEMLDILEYMETLQDSNNKIMIKIAECIKIVEYIKIVC